MGNAQPPRLYAEGTIIANEVRIYSFPCSVKITFSGIKTSSINIVLGTRGPSQAEKLKSIHFTGKLQSVLLHRTDLLVRLFIYLFIFQAAREQKIGDTGSLFALRLAGEGTRALTRQPPTRRRRGGPPWMKMNTHVPTMNPDPKTKIKNKTSDRQTHTHGNMLVFASLDLEFLKKMGSRTLQSGVRLQSWNV